MKKILVVSSIYPGPKTPKGFTPVVHYFVKEWVELGYEVKVICASSYFPAFYYKAPQWLRRLIQNKLGFALPSFQNSEPDEYIYEKVHVLRAPTKKYIPLSGFSEKELQKTYNTIESFLKDNNFTPDVILSHWLNPPIAIVSYLKNKTGAITSLVLHETGLSLKKDYKNWRDLYNNVDIWGYRSNIIKNHFEKCYGTPKYSFRCFSGIPDVFYDNVPQRLGNFNYRFAQVSLLMNRKYPDRTILGVKEACLKRRYELNIVGDGSMLSSLQQMIKAEKCEQNVHLLGRMPRDKVIEILDHTDVFILISRDEVYGLVYIEAMARGCIVVASRNEGMDGIIQDGVNGFFCEAGNDKELCAVIKKIESLSDDERQIIINNAMNTALLLSDKRVACDYIEAVEHFYNDIRDGKNLLPQYHVMNLSLKN